MMLHLPTLNAILNASSACLLILGFIFIKQKKIHLHRACMIGALSFSVLFLTSYIYYHVHHGSTHFAGTGLIRWVYFSILIPHTILAMVIVPMVLRTAYLAFKGRFEKHKKIARWTFPLWLYVSVTGVIVYWMLYHLKS